MCSQTRPLTFALILLTLLSAGTAFGQSATDSHQFLVARMAVENGDFDRALEIFDSLVESDPGNAVLLFERASVYVTQRRMTKALDDLQASVAADPDFYDAQRLLGRILLDRSRGQKEEVKIAVDHLEKAWTLRADDIATGLMVSQLLMNLGEEVRAEKIARDLVDDAPDNRSVNYHYAQVLTKLGRGHESVEYLERVTRQDPTYRPAVFQLVEIYQQQGEWEKAADIVAPMIEADPLDLELQRQQGFFLLRAGRSEEARDRFQSLIEVDPEDGRAKFYLAESLNDLGRQEEAEPILVELWEANPDDPELLVSFGLNQIVLRRFDRASKVFDHLLEIENLPPNVILLARTQLAAIDHQRGEYDRALGVAVKVVTESIRFNGQALNIALDVFRRQDRYGEAVALLEMLVSRFSENPAVIGRYVEFLYRAGRDAEADKILAQQIEKGMEPALGAIQALSVVERYEEAAERLRGLDASHPNELDVRFQLGAALERSGKHEEAEHVFLALLEDHQDHAPTLNYLGYMWADRGVNLVRAEEMISRAVDQFPNNGAYVDSLGWVYFRLGNFDLAKKHLDDAARLIPDDATIQEHLGDVLVQMGEIDRALEVYRTALTLEPEDEAAIHAKIHQIEEKLAQKTFKE